MRTSRVVLTGGTGFIGSAVLRELLRLREEGGKHGICVLAVGRRRPDGLDPVRDTWVRADLARPASLDGVCAGASALLHFGGVLSADAEICRVVNVEGTAALMGEAARAGIGRIAHLSTTAVYGRGPHRLRHVDEVTPTPVSVASASRWTAERHALDAGAVVLRPGLVLGPGDRWVVPALADLAQRVPVLWDGGGHRHSIVTVDALARLAVGTVLGERSVPGGIYHAHHPEPSTTKEIVDSLAGLGALPRLTRRLPWRECLDAFHASHGAVSERQFALLALEHTYKSDDIWERTGLSPGAPPHLRLACTGL
ncbi:MULTISPECIES: NAD-dependent epimerase/dehydratase family protein [unclassified Streptomyces]|uniref:NAD-dependent epimerase/dehydratase family protein n=1 Tax=unclassified Streptomyces TaxID=2593676 RepID=UPI001368C8DC|nr:NAD-dependent epimerase/dehydratase family protein [Streptomyces sp. SID6139]MYR04815.1 NAD-dependent epimerase/dehydratase family protein [Streptomyces sp. SID6139]MYR17586.1 NAD-dependent epimerase/dehydratase family protein [Streptomyces sp. SID6137]